MTPPRPFLSSQSCSIIRTLLQSLIIPNVPSKTLNCSISSSANNLMHSITNFGSTCVILLSELCSYLHHPLLQANTRFEAAKASILEALPDHASPLDKEHALSQFYRQWLVQESERTDAYTAEWRKRLFGLILLGTRVQFQGLSRRVSSKAPLYAGAAIVVSSICGYLFMPSTPTRAAPTDPTAPLAVNHFTATTVLANEVAGPDTKIITLKVNPDLVPTNFLRHPSASGCSSHSPIYSLFLKDSDIQVERPYTPLECADQEGKMRFWVKRYDKGEVGRWLHARKQGEVIELRGPVTTWDWSWRPNEEGWDEVVMISGGTGITPFYQFLHSMLASPAKSHGDRQTQYTLLHASKTPEELPPPCILDPLLKFSSECPDIFRIRLFVDSVPEDSPYVGNIPPSQVGRMGRAAIESSLDINNQNRSWLTTFWRKKPEQPQKRRLFLVCGPELMVNAISGPYGRNYSQGDVGGILGGMGYTSKEVWKL
ncbi:ferredoxin reductase-like C-terminal NADP-linked domain containing protein [Amanita muscaria]